MTPPPSQRWPGTEHLEGDASVLTLRVVVDELARRGLNADVVLRAAGISTFALHNPLGRLPRADIASAVEHAAHLAQDDALHLHATAKAQLGAFGAADFIVSMAPTIGAGCARVARAYALVNSGLELEVSQARGHAMLILHAVYEARPHRLDVETLMVAATQRIRLASGADGATPTQVQRSAPRPTYSRLFEKLLGCPVDWGQEVDSLSYGIETWNLRPVGYHPALTAMMTVFKDALGANDSETRTRIKERTARIIEQRLGDIQLGAASVARACKLSERSFHRRLAAEGTSFSELLDGARQQRAEVYLHDRTLSLAAVATLLGFADASAFSRAYKRWTGKAPRGGRAVTE